MARKITSKTGVQSFGQRLYNIFFKTYTKRCGDALPRNFADWAAQRIKNLSLKEAVRNALLGNSTSQQSEMITVKRSSNSSITPDWARDDVGTLRGTPAERGNPRCPVNASKRIRHRNGHVEWCLPEQFCEWTEFGGAYLCHLCHSENSLCS